MRPGEQVGYITLQDSQTCSNPPTSSLLPDCFPLLSLICYLNAMSDTSIQDRIQIIKALHIAPPQAHAATYGDGQGSATVAGGSLVSFVGNLLAQQKASQTVQFWLVPPVHKYR